jgi:hypothetical protein
MPEAGPSSAGSRGAAIPGPAPAQSRSGPPSRARPPLRPTGDPSPGGPLGHRSSSGCRPCCIVRRSGLRAAPGGDGRDHPAAGPSPRPGTRLGFGLPVGCSRSVSDPARSFPGGDSLEHPSRRGGRWALARRPAPQSPVIFVSSAKSPRTSRSIRGAFPFLSPTMMWGRLSPSKSPATTWVPMPESSSIL